MSERVLVIGGTRGTGFEIVRLLLRDGYRVRALARNPAKAQKKFSLFSAAVEIMAGDITKPGSLPSAMRDVEHSIFTVGVASRPTGEKLIIETEYEGVKNVLAAAREAQFKGRFLYMSSIGVTRPSAAATLLNLIKRNNLRWRKRAEEEIRKSGFDYTIIRSGFLNNRPGGKRTIEVGQGEYPLALKYRISRADIAEVFVQSLAHPKTRRTTFDAVWGEEETDRKGWDAIFAKLRPDEQA